MPLYEPDDAAFPALEERFGWFPGVLEVEYGEREAERETPPELNWLRLLPEAFYWDIEDADCSLAFESGDGYACTIWDVSGEDDRPWAVFVVDDYGARLLPEYSLFDPDAEDEALEEILRRAADELPDRLLAGEFTRHGEPLPIPEWLLTPPETEDDEQE